MMTDFAKAFLGQPPRTGGPTFHLKLKPHLEETCKVSRAPRFLQKLTDVVGLYFNTPERAVVLCVDRKARSRRWIARNRDYLSKKAVAER